MAKKGQITEHEWEVVRATRSLQTHKCKKCPVIKVKKLLFNQQTHYYNRETDVYSNDQPKYITREADKDSSAT